MTRFTTLLLPILLIAISGTLQAGELRGGTAAVDITPLKLPVSMTGGFQDRLAQGVHDRLHARCLVLDDGTSKIALVICDSCLITRDIYDESKADAADVTGIPENRILTAATHTHTAPTAVPLAQCHPDPDYVQHLRKQITQSIVSANANLKPVELGWGISRLPGEVSNRRWFVKEDALQANPFGGTDDRVRTNPPRGIDVLLKPAGPVDPDITFLSLRDAEQKPVALFANYGLHYVGGIPAGQLSADYFGEFARQISTRLNAAESFVGMMSNGASGDVNNYQFLEPRPRSEPFARVKEVAASVADGVKSAHDDVNFIDDATIRMTEQELKLNIRRPDAAELTRARKMLEEAADPKRLTMHEVYARESVRLSEGEPSVTIKLQTITLGDLAIVAIPCEVFAEIGLEIKQKSPFKTTFVIALANGYNGYLPSPKQHALGGYETWRSGWSYLETEASTKITRNVLEMLKAQHQSDRSE